MIRARILVRPIMQHRSAPFFFVQVRPRAAGRWTTHAVAASLEVAERRAAAGWRVAMQLTGADYRVVSEYELEHEGGIVAVAGAVASLHAQALRACRWLPLAREVVGVGADAEPLSRPAVAGRAPARSQPGTVRAPRTAG
jgi:hypothetical protein